MPLRERMRRAFGRKTSSDELVPKRTKSQKADLYRVGDPMPQPKYPGRYNKPHQELLSSFSFSSAFNRRKSRETEVSPMGSSAASRRNSGIPRKSMGQRPSGVGQFVQNAEADDDVRNGTVDRERDPRLHERVPEVQDLSRTRTANGSAHFTEHELSAAVKQTSLQAPAVGAAS
ncbi:MAG: hypothetical protein M1832_003714 [Thelocarpon impressellum]|nr:MAG: hypothetical protein M1832_003714 [Thelocarpon impressellum]